MNRKLTAEGKQYIKAHFATETATDIAVVLGLSKSHVTNVAHALGIYKDKATISRLTGEGIRKRWESERKRLSLGLNKLTKLHAHDDYTSKRRKRMSQWVYRNNYFFDDDNPLRICFDEETRRGKKVEKYAAELGIEVYDCTTPKTENLAS